MHLKKLEYMLLVTFATIVAGACGPRELTSAEAQQLLDDQLPEGTVEVVGVRQTSENEAVARIRLAEMDNFETDITFELFDTGWRPGGSIEFMGQLVPIAQLAGAMDRGRQRRTMADMRNIATANGVMRIDTGRYANNLPELVPEYMQRVPAEDAWGNPFIYTTGQDTYTLTSRGSDGSAGPAPPATWPSEPYEPDIVLTDGMFVQAPTGR